MMNHMKGLGNLLVIGLLVMACSSKSEPAPSENSTAVKPEAKSENASEQKSKEDNDSEQAVKLEKAVITLWHTYRAEEKDALEQVVKAYNEQGGPVTIDAVPVPYDAFVDKLELTIPNGLGPDLFIFAHNMVGHWSTLGLIAPLSEFANPELLKRFLPNTVKALVYNKSLYGLPLAFKNLVLYYNKDMVPKAPTTMQELQALSQGKKWSPPLAFETGLLYFHAPFLFGNDGQLFDDEGKPNLNNQGAINALQMVKELLDAGTISTGLSSVTLSALFNEKKTPFVMNGPWFRGEIDKDINYGVAPLPTLANGKKMKPFLGSEGVFINANSEVKAQAFHAAAFLTSDQGAKVRAAVGQQTIANASLYNEDPIQKDDRFAVFRAQAQEAELMPSHPAMQKVWGHYDTAILKVLSGSASPEDALGAAQALVSKEVGPVEK